MEFAPAAAPAVLVALAALLTVPNGFFA